MSNETETVETTTSATEEKSYTEIANIYAPLTRRERDVAIGLAKGLTNKEIADEMLISQKTVDTHRGHVLKKLGLKNNVTLVHHALKKGWITL